MMTGSRKLSKLRGEGEEDDDGAKKNVTISPVDSG